jgi:flagellar hook-associated protein 3 FlgL
VSALGNNLAGCKKAEEQLLISTARLGSVGSRLERVDSNLQDTNIQLQQTASDNLDADFADVMTRLNAQSNAFQASLNAASRVIQPSLLNFLQ